jgi:tetratricopeptide (TPR) repeat protein
MAAKPAKSKPPAPPATPDPWPAVQPALALFLLVVIAYLPALFGGFIWDDDFHVINCQPLRTLGGLARIWFEPGATQQFYPLTWTSFWIDFHLWKLNPFPYHLENVLLHSVNAILVWRILRRLKVPGGWFGAALFALHPVCVESVAWVSERKNTLSGFFFLLCIRMAIEFWLPAPAMSANKPQEKVELSEAHFGRWKLYWLTLAFYLCAIWCKSVTAVLPGVILLLVWWKRGWWRLKDWLLVLPFLALGLWMASITGAIEHAYVLEAANADEWKLSLPEKFIIAGKAVWFYLGKLCWPHPLVFIYPRWILHPKEPLAYLPLAVGLAGCAGLWWKRNSWGRAPLFVAGYFIAVLLPALGFINIYPFRYSFVADHFQYLASIGPLALAAAGFMLLVARAKNAVVKPVAMGIILAGLGVLTWRQTGIYRNLEVLWRDTLAHDPGSWMAHDNLGLYLTENKRFTEAEGNYRAAIRIRPNDHIAYYDLGLQSAIRGDLNDAVENFNKTLELCPTFAMAHYQIANVLVREGNLAPAINEYRVALKALPNLVVGHYNFANALAQNGSLDEAIQEYYRALEKQPDYVLAYLGLGKTLSAKGDPEGAIGQYRKALVLAPNSVEALAGLGNALISQGKLDDAIGCYRSAIQLDPNSAILHFNLSVALGRQGNTVEADAERAEARGLEGRGQSGQ